jgi:hypothetical protein
MTSSLQNLKGEPRDNHIDTLAESLEEAYRVVRENTVGRERQKELYDKRTRLVIFQLGEMVYLRQMSRAKRGSPKFRLIRKGPYTVIRRLSDLSDIVQVPPRKELVVNLNIMKKCCVTTAPPPSGISDIPVRAQEGDESQGVANGEGIPHLPPMTTSRMKVAPSLRPLL